MPTNACPVKSGRVAQAYGMTRDKHPNAIRFTGNLFTGLVYLIASIACLYFVLTPGGV
jgi:uncharacterized membrane protein YecN with MAPEG domain